MSMISGEKIVALRQQRNWGQRELASAAGVDPSVISRLERNLQEDCMLSILASIAAVLGVTIDELLTRGQASTTAKLVPELQSEVNKLTEQSDAIQRQAAGILRGYLSTVR